MAGRGGARAGAGKRAGQFNRATLEAELASAHQALEQYKNRESKGHKLAIDVLNDVMHAAYGMMAKHQPLEPGQAPVAGQEPNMAEFKEWMRLTREAAGELAPFQSAKFKAVTMTIEAPPGGAVPENPGVARALSAQEAYRMLRESSQLIDLQPNVVKLVAPAKKKARG